MSILIKGAEMPKSCWDCELGSAQQLDGKPCPFYSADYREQKKYSNKRADGCPIVELPPHGRLGDLDALKVKAIERSEKCGGCVNVLDNVITAYDIETAPTIIPAEPAGEVKQL